MTISTPSSRWRRTDMARGDMRTLAVGLSPTLTASMPASLRRAAPWRARRTRRPWGGSTSAETTKRPAASFSRRVAGSAATSGATADGLALSVMVGFRLAERVAGGQTALRPRAHGRLHLGDDELVVRGRDLVEVALEGEAPVLYRPLLGVLHPRRDLLDVQVLLRRQDYLRLHVDAERVVILRLLLGLEHLRVVLEVVGGDLGQAAELHDLRQVEDELVPGLHAGDLAAAGALEAEDVEAPALRHSPF